MPLGSRPTVWPLASEFTSLTPSFLISKRGLRLVRTFLTAGWEKSAE